MNISCLLLVGNSVESAADTRNTLSTTQLNIATVLVAYNLGEALGILSKCPVDVILLDLDLSDSKSLDTLRAVRATTKAVIIVLSDETDNFGIQAIGCGADDFIVKNGLLPKTLRSSILYSLVRYNIREATGRITTKLDKLSQLPGGG